MASMKELEQALISADQAGDTDAARKLAAFITEARKDPVNMIPDQQVEGTVMREPEPTLGEQAVGAGEAALTTATGATTGAIGYIGGALKGIAEEILSGQFGQGVAEGEAAKGAQALTYAPRTKTGQEYVEAIGEAVEPLTAVAPMMGELQAIGAGARAAVPAVRTAGAAAREQVAAPLRRAREAVRPTPEPAAPGVSPAAGAAPVEQAVVRQAAAEELPVPIELTKGQKERTFEQQRFERETAKLPEAGAPLRERFAEQNLKLQQNLDAFIDKTGAELGDLRGVGEVVDQALRQRAAKDKTKIRILYKEAEKSGEMEAPVNLESVVTVLNESKAAESTAPVLTAAKKELVRLGGAVEDAEGNLVVSGRRDIAPTLKSDAYLEVENPIFDPNAILADKDLGLHRFDFQRAPIKQVNVDEISSPQPGINPRKLARITDEFSTSEVDPIFVVEVGNKKYLAGGNHRVNAAKANGYSELPAHVIKVDKSEIISRTEPSGLSLKDAEQLRKFINKTTGNDPTNIKFAADLKRAIDAATEGKGGQKYKQARAARAKYAREYENVGLVKRLIGTKRGSNDRAIAMEDVLRKTILDPSTSLDEMRHVRRLLQTKGGEPGKQSWRELQGATLRHIQEQMTKGITTDQAGNRVVSPAQLDRAITQLDRSGKLDYVFGKRGAEQLRTINDVAKDVLTAPPGVINTSNTASVLAGLMDVAISGTVGVPAPIMSSFRLLTKSITDAKLKAQIKQALGE